MTEEKKKLILVICLSITILVTVIGLISSIDIGDDIMPKPTPVTTKPTGNISCLHSSHTAVELPICTNCNEATQHAYSGLIYEQVSNTLIHKVNRTCLVCKYTVMTTGDCVYSSSVCSLCKGACPHTQHNVRGLCSICDKQLSLDDGHYWHDKNGNCKKCGVYVGHQII